MLVETKARVGVFAIALGAYLPQFPSLVPEFEGQYAEFKRHIPASVEIVDGGIRITGAEEGLVTIEIPKKIGEYPVQSIGDYAFSDCSGLRTVHVSGSLKSIGTGAFTGCTLLSEITLGDALESIGDENEQTIRSLSTPRIATSCGTSIPAFLQVLASW